MELYPRIGKHFDIKVFTNCRFGMMSWAVLAVTYCIKQVNDVMKSLIVRIKTFPIFLGSIVPELVNFTSPFIGDPLPVVQFLGHASKKMI